MFIRQRWIWIIAAGSAVIIAAFAVRGQEATGSPQSLTLFEVDAIESHIDTDGDGGFSAGDVVLEDAALIDTNRGLRIGRAHEEIRVMAVDVPPSESDPLGDWELFMHATFVLPRGEISFGGYATIEEFKAREAVLAVFGGTGEYAGAGGTATLGVGEFDGETGPLITFDLIR